MLNRFDDVDVRETYPGEHVISWGGASFELPVEICVGTSPGGIDRNRPVTVAQADTVTVAGLPVEARHYFLLRFANGVERIAAQRNLSLEGGVNFRDMGGYATRAGTRVHWGRLFRSGHMNRFTERDRALVRSLGIEMVCDFRKRQEAQKESGEPLFQRVETLSIVPGGDDTHLREVFNVAGDPDAIAQAVRDINHALMFDFGAVYKTMFELMLDCSNNAVLINCSAGKERTGVGAMLILMALGVPRETVIYDYMLSHHYYPAEQEVARVKRKYEVNLEGEAARRMIWPLLETRLDYVEPLFEDIDRRYRSDEDFLEQVVGLRAADLERLRQSYTS